jgi:cell division protease FtsH
MLEPATGLPLPGRPVSEATLQRIDSAIRGIVMDAFERASAILALNRPVLDRGARALLDQETLDEAAIRALASELQRA